MKIIKSPSFLLYDDLIRGFSPKIFLAGSIEMGTAENWQEKVQRMLKKEKGIIFNPRRDDWDSTQIQSIDNPYFRQQVEWELEAMRQADIIPMYFDPTTKSPITLLELGLNAHQNKLIVCCPDGFWRKGNVDIVCNVYKIQMADSLPELVEQILLRVEKMK